MKNINEMHQLIEKASGDVVDVINKTQEFQIHSDVTTIMVKEIIQNVVNQTLQDKLVLIKAKRECCKYCNTQDLHWANTFEGWRLINDQGELHRCDLDSRIRYKIAEHKIKYPTFKDEEFLKWLYEKYIPRETEEETLNIKKYVAYAAKINKLNHSKHVGESVARYASLEHT